jgi:hypothetical protein
MRELITSLNKSLGSQHNKEINKWVNKQYNRISQYGQEAISLNDVKPSEVVNVVMSTMTQLDLTPIELFRYCLVVPSLNKGLQSFIAVMEIMPGFYKHQLTVGKKIAINDMAIAYHGERFERYGSDKHIIHKPNLEKTHQKYCFINGTIIDESKQFSVGFNEAEIQGIGESIFEKKYNGVNPFNKKEWDDIVFSALYHRLYDEPAFIMQIENVLKEDKLIKFEAARKNMLIYYDEDSDTEKESLVYSSYGQLIAKKSNRFNALTARKSQNSRKPDLKVVASNPQIPKVKKAEPKTVEKALTVCDKGYVNDEWGGF